MTTPQHILTTVETAMDALITAGKPYNGLFPSLLDRESGLMLDELPTAIPGQRDNDRAHLGSNLTHDFPLLHTMYALSASENTPRFAAAADRYLAYWAKHCTQSPSGLFPWGEHSFWHLRDHHPGASYNPGHIAGDTIVHDHLRQIPLWLWEKLNALNPDAVQRFADGLDNHWTAGEPREYIRHALLNAKNQHWPREGRSCDFPRHGGFYILDWTFAYLQHPRPELLNQIHAMLDYWWQKKGPNSECMVESRTPPEITQHYRVYAPGQTLSLAVSLFETAALLQANNTLPNLQKTLRERASVYINGYLAAPHDPQNGIFVSLYHSDTGELHTQSAILGGVYGGDIAAATGVIMLRGAQFASTEQREALLDHVRAMGEVYLQATFPAVSEIERGSMPEITDNYTQFNGHHFVRAADAGHTLNLLCELYVTTAQEKWLDGALSWAERFIDIYCDQAIPRGAANIAWYESQLGSAYLLYGLTRTAFLARDGASASRDTSSVLPPDYTQR